MSFTSVWRRKTGQATGYRRCGSYSLATNEERFEELRRSASMAKVFGLEVEVVTPSTIKARVPLLHTDDVLGGIHIPTDGYANAVDITNALARGARGGGARIFQNVPVTAIRTSGGSITGVTTERGDIDADCVVLCAGMWTRELAATVGVNVPLHACEHYYALFESVEGLDSSFPVVRDYDACAYYKYDAGKLMLGAFEPHARPWAMEGIPEDFCFDEIDGSLEHFEPILEQALFRVPGAGIRRAGDVLLRPRELHPGRALPHRPGARSRQLFCSGGTQFHRPAVRRRHRQGALRVDPPRPPAEGPLGSGCAPQSALPAATGNTCASAYPRASACLYATHYPYRQYDTARGVRKSPLHDRLKAIGACHGELAGWERPNWYAPEPALARYEYSYGRQNWFEHSAAEHRAVREQVGLFDQSSFAKFRLEGRDAARVLGRVCANQVDVHPDRIVYTQWLNDRGGIEADLTVTRLAEDCFLIVTAAATEARDFDWLQRHIPADARCVLTNVTSAMAVISIMGPNARALLQSLTPNDLSHESFPFAHSREIELGYALVRASRITYVGELGWELYVPTEFAAGVYDAIVAAGEPFGLTHAGYHALDSLRIEKAYRHWGHDITDEDTPLEAGLGFAMKFDKPGGFIGREALLRDKAAGPAKRLLQFRLLDPGPLLYHNEPIWRDDALVGHVTSGAYGHTLGGAIGLGYVDTAKAPDPADGDFRIEVAGKRVPAEVSSIPKYDPGNKRIRC